MRFGMEKYAEESKRRNQRVIWLALFE